MMSKKFLNRFNKLAGFILFSFNGFCFASELAADMQNIKRDDHTVEHIQFQTPVNEKSDLKLTRKGVLFKNKNAVATVVLLHGYMCDKFDVGFLRNMFPYGRFNFLSF